MMRKMIDDDDDGYLRSGPAVTATTSHRSEPNITILVYITCTFHLL